MLRAYTGKQLSFPVKFENNKMIYSKTRISNCNHYSIKTRNQYAS